MTTLVIRVKETVRKHEKVAGPKDTVNLSGRADKTMENCVQQKNPTDLGRGEEWDGPTSPACQS